VALVFLIAMTSFCLYRRRRRTLKEGGDSGGCGRGKNGAVAGSANHSLNGSAVANGGGGVYEKVPYGDVKETRIDDDYGKPSYYDGDLTMPLAGKF
jgi:hypothetical protein